MVIKATVNFDSLILSYKLDVKMDGRYNELNF